jgi:hypothetical protein
MKWTYRNCWNLTANLDSMSQPAQSSTR